MPDIHRELLKVKHMPPWPRKQGDAWDRGSRFIYHTEDLDTLREKTRRAASELGASRRDFGGYVIHRWYNFHTHQAALKIILTHSGTRPEADPFHHTVDFYLDGTGFDLKMTRLPGGFGHDLHHARAHPEELARWLYVNQSRQGRFHAANRLFVVLHDERDPAHTWELRRDLRRLERAIHAFLRKPHLIEVEFEDQNGTRQRPTAGVILCVRE